jgi:hypothetical protein
MRKKCAMAFGLTWLLAVGTVGFVDAQTMDTAAKLVEVSNDYQLVPNITDLRAGGWTSSSTSIGLEVRPLRHRR